MQTFDNLCNDEINDFLKNYSYVLENKGIRVHENILCYIDEKRPTRSNFKLGTSGITVIKKNCTCREVNVFLVKSVSRNQDKYEEHTVVLIVNRREKELYLFNGLLDKKPERLNFLTPFNIRKMIYGIFRTLTPKKNQWKIFLRSGQIIL